ncbi:MAG: PPC domain-containing protein [Spirochaetales bacterium]|nr:PPC domain-containing protein [Spirochaetales bacterium]
MKKILPALLLFAVLSALGADELMANLRDASDQVSGDVVSLLGDDLLYSGAITFENRPVVLGDLFSDLLANRLLGNSRFKGTVVKGYSPGISRISDADWTLSGSLYKTGASFFLSLYLNDKAGQQKKGWEFLLPAEGVESLLTPSQMAVSMGGDIYEPNDSYSQAVPLSPEPDLELDDLQIGDSGDEDWFYIDVEQVGSGTDMFILSVRTTGSMDTYLELYAPSDTSYPVAENDDGSDSNASLSYALTETGRWYIKVRGYSSDETGDYGLHAGLEMREAGPGEPDNSIGQASVLEIEGEEISRTMDYAEDYDYFKITLDRNLSEDKALVIETYSGLDLTMTLLDEYDNEVVTNDDSGQDSNPQIMLPAMESGTWYAVVYPYDSENIGPYSIRAYLKDVIRDKYENDDSMEEAGDIQVNGPEQVRTFIPAGEEDWVRFVADEAEEFLIRTTGPIDTYMSLYDQYGELLAEDDDGGNENNALISQRLEAGVYYIQITQYEGDGNVEDSYTLSVKKY